MHTRFLAFSAIAMLGACSGLDPVTAMRLATMDPLSADPAGMAVALRLPDGLGIEDGSAMLRLNATNAEGEQVDGEYLLEQSPDYVWRVAPGDQSRLRADQATVVAWERSDPDGTTGSFSAGLTPCRIGDGPAPDATLSVDLELAAGGGFFPLLRNAPVSSLQGASGTGVLQTCR